MLDFQPSLLDLTVDESDPGGAADEVTFGGLDGEVGRTHLSRGAWVDVRPRWLRGADDLFARLVADVDWQAERRQMYDRVVDVPRLTRFYDSAEEVPHPAVAAAKHRLDAFYAGELGEVFVSAGLAYYRDGRDSVAWHGDTIGRAAREDTMVAIVSLGDPRRLSLRPRGGGESTSFTMGHGDLVVMGGSCQRTWEHAVLKTAAPVGPRISVQLRTRGVR
ncbi:alpha-ketoglutarate-dependent dioxygenase AlkB [Nocardioidaceae bacterium]|nr:alpha-ketoglutarate-dependent dioxygenase AlkB [Nocardioidaceae bacterium]